MITRAYGTAEGIVSSIDKKLHDIRKPITMLVAKVFIKLRMNDRHVTAVRFALVLVFFLFWIQSHYGIAAAFLALNILLDMVDGDFARSVKNDSDARSFVDVTVDNT